jgi:hypothetical protein
LSDSKFNDIGEKCLQQAICNNYSLANKLVAAQNLEQETGIRKEENRQLVERTKIDMINYIVGIMAMGFLWYKK